MEPNDRSPWQGPIYMRPGQYREGLRPVRNMLNSDLLLVRKIPPAICTPDEAFGPVAGPPVQPDDATIQESDLASLQEYLQSRETNIVVPNPTPPDPAPTDESPPPFWDISLDGPSVETSLKDGGIGFEHRRGIREYLASGYTRTNPDGTYEQDDDFGGKFETEVTIAEGSAEHSFFDTAVAEGSFGNDDSFMSGKGSVLSADANMSAGFQLTNEALKGTAEIQASGQMLEGSIKTTDDGLVAGEAAGSLMSGEAAAATEIVLSPEEATLTGELGASINLMEGSISGDFHITPRRVVSTAVGVWSWFTGDDATFELDENWDVGLIVGGELSGQFGAQAGVAGELSHKDGRATAEAGAKIGLGLGVGAKGRVGISGTDVIGRAIKNAWTRIKSAWNSDWWE